MFNRLIAGIINRYFDTNRGRKRNRKYRRIYK